MPYQSIVISKFRNLADQRLELSPLINIVDGKNGSGKSSLIESLYYLSVGKSFRSSKLDSIIEHNSSGFTLFSVTGDDNSHQHRVGISREKNKPALIKIDGEFIRSAIQLATITPTLVIEPETFDLLDGGPNNRRRYMDWGVFHVEHRFSEVWRRYTKSLKQRNTLLRRGRIDRSLLAPWDGQMATTAAMIDQYRNDYIMSLVPVINDILKSLNQTIDIDISYYRGWDKKTDYKTILEDSIERDIRSGFTHQGPHRADIRIKVNGRFADEVLSRGQKKILIFAMILAQGAFLSKLLGRKSVYLIDDISAELDIEHRKNVCSYLEKLESQVVLTVVDIDSVLPLFRKDTELRMFHVEHGKVSQVN
ncbi:DNA replication/repair protein RecF [Alkalimarinus sediminis]|uniref:DNA replication and repair protein RecF n=1 Tax=Alkalimarinus sediminis TaxID=1632866 RepID=A0A9E8HI07_9ALTE|nr:DNA replication/repair protein RecF [Alkalimarinus sediminis]UZW75030.1 DNA replication/repair protein RecF [Alkalimarinus sediminis]